MKDDTPSRSHVSVPDHQGVKVVRRITVNRSAEELFRYWRRFENLPTFIEHLESVTELPGGRSHWITKSAAGKTFQWDAEIINEKPPALLAWRSLDGADIPNAGTVRFDPAPPGRGTEVTITLEFAPPAGALGKSLAKLLGESPELTIHDDLRRFKCVLETGELPTTSGQPVGPRH